MNPNTIAQDEKNQAVFSSVDDLARHLHLSRHSTYLGLRSGDIPSIRVGKRFVLPKSAIEGWLKNAGGRAA